MHLKHLFFAALMGFALSCTSGGSGTSLTTANARQDTIQHTDAHDAQNSLDWAGMYKGVVPCADCEGIGTILVLNSDDTYLLKQTYLGKPDAVSTEKTGKFTWKDDKQTIVLEGIDQAPNQYKVAENKVTQLDMQGNKITGDLSSKYILNKQ